MAETHRTLAEILANLPDNITGLIDPEDIRDLVISLNPVHGSLHRGVAADTVIGLAGTYVKALGTTIAGDLHDMTMSQDNRLTFTGPASRHFHVMASVSMTASGSNKIIGMKLAKNGVVLDQSVVRRAVTTGSDIGAAMIQADMSLDTGDYVEIWVTNETTATNVKLDEFHLHASGTLE